MKQVTFWEAEDGRRFDSKTDCERYESMCFANYIFEHLECYTSARLRIYPGDDFDLDSIFYIKITGDAEKEQNVFIEFKHYFEDNYHEDFPFSYVEVVNDVLVYGDNGWRSLRSDIDDLMGLACAFEII